MRFFKLFASLAAVAAIAACAPAKIADVTKGSGDHRLLALDARPVVKTFAPGPPVGVQRGNADLAADFLDLNFRMESGSALPVLTRFESPITVALTGDVPPVARTELLHLVKRLQAEADLTVSLVSGPTASIIIDFQPKSALRRAVPSAACFVVPNVSGLADYRRQRNSPAVDWARLERRDRVAIIAPSDASPQEVRDCLHEELAQAMGPLNDLFRLTDSVFNDDNFHAALTGFDMLMLRVHYAPELRSGLTEAEVAARLPTVLSRLNPRGEGVGAAPRQISPRSWITATQSAFGGRGTNAIAAERMVAIASAMGWTDGRMAFSLFARGRALTGRDAAAATQAYTEAAQIWRNQPGGQIHVAYIDMQLAAFALSAGQFDRALTLTDAAIPVARSHQNATLLASLLAMRAEALEAMGRLPEARSARLDSLAWARYAFGSEAQVRARLSDIATLARRGAGG